MLAIKKNIFQIGMVEYRLASTRDELEQAYKLIYQEYSIRGLILPEHYKTPCRITLHLALPGTITIIALKEGKVVGTTSIIPDSPLGLPLDKGYEEEMVQVRKSRRKFCEIGYLSISSHLFPRGIFSLFNFSKLDFMCTMFRFVADYPYYCMKVDDVFIVTNPKLMLFKYLTFKEVGPVKHYGFDYSSIKRKPAVLKILDLHKFHKGNIYKRHCGQKIPDSILNHRFKMNADDLRYFFVEKSDVFKKATHQERECIRELYHLTPAEFENLMR